MLICPECNNSLDFTADLSGDITCRECSRTFCRTNGFISFDNESFAASQDYLANNDDAFIAAEDEATEARISRYFVPQLRRLGLESDARILCLGCGGGADVAALRALGYQNAFGVEMGWRSVWWKSRGRDADSLFIVGGNALPFQDDFFDLIICLGVIEHVGAIGSGAQLYPDYREIRQRFLAEAVRVLSKNGKIILSCPNRTFPVDFQHNISKSTVFKKVAAKTGVSFHSPRHRFLNSYQDIRAIASTVSDSLIVEPMPVAGFLGLSFKKSPYLRPLSSLFDQYLAVLDKMPSTLRMSFFNPYMITLIHHRDRGL
ncbi:MAG: class I SAM-dependent methyltransferase [Desulfuromonadales bacterium]|nr:class I SAM-dependent methyltransferase [Desulfuromonadales bacterium]